MRCLVLGCTGQDGSLLSNYLVDKGHEVYGMIRRTSSSTDWRLKELGLYEKPSFHVVSGDLSDQGSLDRLIRDLQPKQIYNLAAQSFVGCSWDNWETTTDITGLGPVRVFEAALKYAPKAKIYQASSSEMFGGDYRREFLNEESNFQPRSPYGAAKCYAHNMAEIYRTSYNLFISCGILFNHEGPYRGLEFVTRKITNAVARIKLGLENKLLLGNLESRRDWGNAGDYIEAMYLMLQKDKPDDFVIATGTSHSIRDLCAIAFRYINLNYEDYVEQDPKFYRPADVGYLLGDANKAKVVLGWKPKTKFQDMIIKMIEADLNRLKV